MNKNLGRLRRATKTRCKIKELNVPRLSVHRTPRNIYAQLIAVDGKVLASASSLSAEFKKTLSYGGNVKAAEEVGKLIAGKVKNLGISKVAFDRSGYLFHGRVKALADAARSQGLEF